MVDLLALASRSTSHRPSCPKARRAMPRSGPVPVTRPVTARCSHAAPDKSEATIWHREDRGPTSQLGWLPGASALLHTFRPPGEPAGLPMWNRWHSSRAPAPLTLTLPKRGTGPVFRRTHPEVDPTDSASGPGQRCAFRYGAYLREPITPGQGVLLNSQGSPQNFLVTHRKRQFIHRSCTGLPTLDAAGEGAGAPAVPNRVLTSERRDLPIRGSWVDVPGPHPVEWRA